MKCPTDTRLIAHVKDMQNVKLHILYLQSLISVGLKVTKLHRVIQAKCEPWMRNYVLTNTALTDQSEDEFSKQFYKLK